MYKASNRTIGKCVLRYVLYLLLFIAEKRNRWIIESVWHVATENLRWILYRIKYKVATLHNSSDTFKTKTCKYSAKTKQTDLQKIEREISLNNYLSVINIILKKNSKTRISHNLISLVTFRITQRPLTKDKIRFKLYNIRRHFTLYFVYDSLRIMECWRYSVALNLRYLEDRKVKIGRRTVYVYKDRVSAGAVRKI